MFLGIYRYLQEIYQDHHSLESPAAFLGPPYRSLEFGVKILLINFCLLPHGLLECVYNNALKCLGGAITARLGVMADASLWRQFDGQSLSESLQKQGCEIIRVGF